MNNQSKIELNKENEQQKRKEERKKETQKDRQKDRNIRTKKEKTHKQTNKI